VAGESLKPKAKGGKPKSKSQKSFYAFSFLPPAFLPSASPLTSLPEIVYNPVTNHFIEVPGGKRGVLGEPKGEVT
jgi:hypothetical protein